MSDSTEAMWSLSVWGGGQLFAFSGLDGPTDFDTQLVGRTSYEGCGLDIKLPSDRHWGACPNQCELRFADRAPDQARLAGDWFVLRLGRETVRGAMLDNAHVLVEGPCAVRLNGARVRSVQAGPRTLVGSARGFDPSRLDANLNEAIAERSRWLGAAMDEAARRPRVRGERLPLLAKCLSVMKTQVYAPQGRIRHRWTTADRWPHRRMFLWDSVFHAMGFRHVDRPLAREAICALLDLQQDDGMVGHMHDPHTSSRLSQPPLLTLGLTQIDSGPSERPWLREVYPRLSKFIEWCLGCDSDGAGLLEWRITDDVACRCDECGADNSSRFDVAQRLDAPDFNAFVSRECELLAEIADALDKPEDARRWRGQRHRLNDLINARLWNEELGFYVDAFAGDGRQTNILATSGFFPLLCGAASASQAARLAEHAGDPETFGTPLPLPTIAACHEHDGLYESDMWRGPVWMNYNWLAAEGFDRYGLSDTASSLRRRSLDAVGDHYRASGCLHEFYDDRQRVDPGMLRRKRDCRFDVQPHMVIRDYGWTAACCADWIFRGF